MNNGSWNSSTLTEIVEDAIGGLWGSPPDSQLPDEADVLVVRGADFRDWGRKRALGAARRRIPMRSLERRRLRPGDLVLEVSGGSPAQPVGRTLIVDERAASESPLPLICSNFCRKIRLKPGVDPHFVKRQLDWLYHTGHVDRFQTSTTNIRNLQVDSFLRETEVVLPPKELQTRITTLLDAIEDRWATSLGHVAAAKRTIERLRVALLAAAYREAAGSEGLDSLVPLSELLREPLKNGYSARPVNHETRFRVLTLTATTSGWFDRKQFKYTDEEFAPESPFWLTPGDIVIQRGNTAEYVGVAALYDGVPGAFLYPDLMIRARVLPEVDPRFVWYMLLAPQARRYLRDRATGSAGNMPKINQRVLADLPVPLPPIAVRQQIVARLDKAFALTADIGERVTVASRRVDRTSQAVLSKAFRGELVFT